MVFLPFTIPAVLQQPSRMVPPDPSGYRLLWFIGFTVFIPQENKKHAKPNPPYTPM